MSGLVPLPPVIITTFVGVLRFLEAEGLGAYIGGGTGIGPPLVMCRFS